MRHDAVQNKIQSSPSIAVVHRNSTPLTPHRHPQWEFCHTRVKHPANFRDYIHNITQLLYFDVNKPINRPALRTHGICMNLSLHLSSEVSFTLSFLSLPRSLLLVVLPDTTKSQSRETGLGSPNS